MNIFRRNKKNYVQKNLLKHFFDIKSQNKKIIYTNCRGSTIIPLFIGYIFNVHSGKSYTRFLVTKEMIGYKLGEFSSTRKPFSFKKQKRIDGTKSKSKNF